jgi:uncharacterized protein (DUF1786 family)
MVNFRQISCSAGSFFTILHGFWLFMRILTIDIGTGTQDILLYDSHLDIENSYKMVLPSPTMMIHRRLVRAVHDRTPVLLTGETMGGGPSSWAIEKLLQSGIPVFSTPDAARTMNDDLDIVKAMGIQLVSEDEADHFSSEFLRVSFADFDFRLIEKTFLTFGISLSNLDFIAVAVFDHGAAPAHVSDRQFRFDYLDQCIRKHNRLSAFAYPSEEIPESMTRMKAVAHSTKNLSTPLVVMDTAPAAILGALFDPFVAKNRRQVICNVGNFHTLAFRLGEQGIEGLFEHHTGLLDQTSLENLINRLASGILTRKEVYDQHGHGALLYAFDSLSIISNEFPLVLTGPRRSMLIGSSYHPYFAVPFGDMMITGCIGLLAAVADLYPSKRETLLKSLQADHKTGIAPWEIP